MLQATKLSAYAPRISLSLLLAAVSTTGSAPAAEYHLFARTNLVAWCIVPFDAKKRGPEERAAMLEKLGLKRLAYDYRAQHVPTFDAEMEALQRHRIELTAWWFPTTLNDEARRILDVLKRHQLKTQLWVTGNGEPTKTEDEQRARVEAEARRVRPLAEEAARLGCTIGLYGHGGWFGQPENQIAVIERLKQEGVTNVGLVYNQHHGHEHLDRFAELLERMKPYLLVLNLNGMTRDGDKAGKKILPVAQGDLDLALLRTIRQSGWRGSVGILNHTDADAEARLLDNLDGLEWLAAQLDGPAPGPKPALRSWPER
jgi:sugar phosphate isomerase/epimerase